MPKLKGRIPKYRLHRRSGQAIVTLDGRDQYLGPSVTQFSKQETQRNLAEIAC